MFTNKSSWRNASVSYFLVQVMHASALVDAVCQRASKKLALAYKTVAFQPRGNIR